MNDLTFPYPHVIDALDRYYGVNSHVQQADRKKDLSFTVKKQDNIPTKKLSILIATFWDYPHIGGLSNYITTLKDGLLALGHKVDVISPNQFSKLQRERLRRKIVPELKTMFKDRYGTFTNMILLSSRLLYVYEQMLHTIDLEKYDIFHAQDIFTANILGRANEKFGKPLLFTPHGMFTLNRLKFNRIDKGSPEEVYYTAIERKAIQYASHTIILSDSFREPLISLGAKSKDMTTIHTGIDFHVTPNRTSYRKKIVISCIARLGPRKGHSDLLKALSQISQWTEQVEVQIVGDGEMREQLEAEAAALQLTNVRFLGKRKDIASILSRTDIFVLATINDSLPISIIEAMHAGTAIVTTNCGGITEIVHHHQTGLIIAPGDHQQLAKELKSLIENKQLRDTLGIQALQYAKQHLTREAMTEKIEEIYQNFYQYERRHHKHPAVVLDLSANGVGLIHALARRGIEVHAFDTEKAYAIGRSRLASCGICPSPLTQEDQLLTFLIETAEQFQEKPVLYAGADDYVVFISKFRHELAKHYLFLCPDHSLIEQVLDKKKTYELLVKYRIPTPKTFFVETVTQLNHAITQLEFPCILKPVAGHEYRKHINTKAIYIHDVIQLKREFPHYRQYGELIIQEIIPGDNQCFYKVATLFDDQMNLLALFTLQKNHQFPAHFGTGAHIVSRRIPELAEYGITLLKELKLKGVGMIEYKKDPRDGLYKLIEINPRFWLTHSLTGHSGVDFAYQYYLTVTNQHPTPLLEQKENVQWIYLVRYFLTFLEKRKLGEMTFKDFLTGFKGKKVFALFALDDPMPFIRSTVSHLRNAWKKKRRES